MATTTEPAASLAPYDPHTDDYLTTASKTYVSRNATVHGASRLDLKGRVVIERDCVLHADVASIVIGQYCYIQCGTTIRPSTQVLTNKPIHVVIGAHTRIGSNCQIHAAAIGSHCVIGNNVTIGQRVIIKDCCHVADNTVLTDNVVLPPFTRIQPCAQRELQWSWPNLKELPIAVQAEVEQESVERYHAFVRKQEASRAT